MDTSTVMKQMLEAAMKAYPESFRGFDATKNVQDQLQAMVGLSLLNLLVSFYKFVELKKAPSYAAGFTSMEQLWLAAVMDWNFNKIWDGEDWVKNG